MGQQRADFASPEDHAGKIAVRMALFSVGLISGTAPGTTARHDLTASVCALKATSIADEFGPPPRLDA
jgi:hypothetical protein